MKDNHMNMATDTVTELAARLDSAEQDRIETNSLADDIDIDVDAAYAIQEELVARRCARGENLVGVKLGFTSRAKMAQMGVSEIIVGRLTDAMEVAEGESVDLSRFIHPKIEPEIAYRISADIDFDGPVPDIAAYVDAVAPAMEIIDSRYRDFRFTYTDVVADNTSAAAYAIGRWRPLQDVSNRAVRLSTSGTVVEGSTNAVLDDPANAVRELLEIARRRRIPLRAGYVVLAGAATAATPLTTGSVECEVEGLGTVSLKGIA
ncbi:4-oxalocrotonate decarboxylase [Rhodococcus pyridinivorans]|nr:4-oxalocrotonate decarboxylase [Rhodococcus pyridinivorans]USI91473.1 4-oxalocrotonate decarboxylase [Rhodococcus pyridinivorans]UTM38378.1 4-oxalocrotonate decarboxylase [Rhodococcus pyridinivorans]